MMANYKLVEFVAKIQCLIDKSTIFLLKASVQMLLANKEIKNLGYSFVSYFLIEGYLSSKTFTNPMSESLLQEKLQCQLNDASGLAIILRVIICKPLNWQHMHKHWRSRKVQIQLFRFDRHCQIFGTFILHLRKSPWKVYLSVMKMKFMLPI